MMLVSLQAASDHIRRDTSYDDADLELKIHAASGAVLNYLKDAAEDFLDSAGQVIEDSSGDPVGVPFEVQAAVMHLVGIMYSERGASESFERGYLPMVVTALLYPLRTPSLA